MIAEWTMTILVLSAAGNDMITVRLPEIPTEAKCIELAKSSIPAWIDIVHDAERIEIRCTPVTGDPIVDGVNRAVIDAQQPVISYGPKEAD